MLNEEQLGAVYEGRRVRQIIEDLEAVLKRAEPGIPASLISAAAEAQEIFGDDELEKYG